MDDELQLNDPDHPDAQEAARATARLLLAVHQARVRKTTGIEETPSSETEKEKSCPNT